MSQLGLGMTEVTEEVRGRGPSRRGGGVAVLIAAGVVLALVAVVLFAVVRWFSTSPDYQGDGHGEVQVQIRIGEHRLIAGEAFLRRMGRRHSRAQIVRHIANRIKRGIACLVRAFKMRGLRDRATAQNTDIQRAGRYHMSSLCLKGVPAARRKAIRVAGESSILYATNPAPSRSLRIFSENSGPTPASGA